MATQTEIGMHLDIGERQVRKLVENGVLPRAKARRGLDIDACRFAYINYLRGLASGQINPALDPANLANDELSRAEREAKLRLVQEQADGQALKNAQARRELAPVQLISWTLARVGSQISAIFDSIPLKVKKLMPKLSASDIEVIKRELIKAQNAASRVTVDLDEYYSGGAAEDE
jgi:phage terminase Nu1 subunit (DNA packaging protein)